MRRLVPSIAFAVLAVLAVFSAAAHAGDITATVTGGSLHLVGTANAESLEIDQLGVGANEFRLVPSLGTTVNGMATPVTLGGVTKDVVIDLGNGGDGVVVAGVRVKRDVVIQGGMAGTIDVTLVGVTVDRDVRAATPISNVVLAVNSSTVRRNVRFDGGSAGDVCNVIASLVRGNVDQEGNGGGDLLRVDSSRVLGKITGDGGPSNDDLEVELTHCGKGVDWTGGDNNDSVLLHAADVDGDVKVDGAGGDDDVTIDACEIAGGITIGFGDGAMNEATLGPLDCGKSLRILGGTGADTVSAVGTCNIGGDVRADLGNGANDCDLDQVQADGDVRLTSGTGADFLRLANATVRGSVRADAGGTGGLDKLNLVGDSIRGSVKLAGADSVQVGVSATTVGGTGTFTTGNAPSTVDCQGSRFRQLRVATGPSGDVVVIGGCATAKGVIVTCDNGANTMTIANTVIGGDLRVTMGANDDFLSRLGGVVAGKTKIDLGGGNNTQVP